MCTGTQIPTHTNTDWDTALSSDEYYKTADEIDRGHNKTHTQRDRMDRIRWHWCMLDPLSVMTRWMMDQIDFPLNSTP